MANDSGFLALLFLICCCMLVSCISNKQAKVFRLSSGHDMPAVGLGTHGMNDEGLTKVLTAALDKGFRHIDTGFVYKNEQTIGEVLKEWFKNGGKREDIFITTKLPYYDSRASSVEKCLKLSLERLGLEYVDMYLIHTPFGILRKPGSYEFQINDDGTFALDYEADPIAVWKEMEKQVKAGRTRSIGLSNFNETQISDILKVADIKPSNLQVEVHLCHQQKPLREFCKSHQILVTGYAPLASADARKHLQPRQSEDEFRSVFTLPIVKEIAKNHNRSVVQVLLRHTVQGGAAVVPSSKNPEHLASNLALFDFELSDVEMARLDAIDKGERGRIFDYKFFKGVEKHPYYPWASAIN